MNKLMRNLATLPDWCILMLRVWTGTDALALCLILGVEAAGLLAASAALSWLVVVSR